MTLNPKTSTLPMYLRKYNFDHPQRCRHESEAKKTWASAFNSIRPLVFTFVRIFFRYLMIKIDQKINLYIIQRGLFLCSMCLKLKFVLPFY